ncbi:MAG: nucleotide-binding protein [Candidatus Poribacteria bacterium]|nr:nucleotide-binding protein [Candidatus Poribacteria bacterium]
MNYKNGTYLSAIESLSSPFEDLKRAQESLLGSPFEDLKRAQESLLGSPFEDLKRAQDAIVSVREPAVDWQKRVNFLSETQASLGFPNIIRGELAVDPFRISIPTQRRTPLLDLPPTSSTDEVYEEISPEIIPAPAPELVPNTSRGTVFIVHGHDHASRDTVANFVDNWGLTATILDKQPNKGRTIIEKFENCADEASFAIVLLTPDDVGASVNDKAHLKYRARQNVIYEWGYFSGSIGRERVCILYKGNIELPSDTQGVVYVRMDDNGDWKQEIVREMEAVGLLIDGNEI